MRKQLRSIIIYKEIKLVNCETLKFLQMHMQMKHYTKARSRYIRLVAVLRC